MQDFFVGRLPILDRRQCLIGYELRLAAADGSAAATAHEVIAKAFNDLGLARALTGSLAFIPVDADFLKATKTAELATDSVVLQVSASALRESGVADDLLVLRAGGAQYCITDLLGLDAQIQAVLAQASYLKIDRRQIPLDSLQALICDLRTTRRPVIITGVDTAADFEFCSLLGADGYQGYYFADSRPQPGKALDPGTQTLFRLIGQLSADADIESLEETFRSDPVLVVHLLRLTNSAGVGARSRITSVRHAINVLGRKQLQRWLQLLLFRQGSDAGMANNPLMQYAALRGRFMELLSARVSPGEPALRDGAFITGLISVLPAALGLTLVAILEHLPVEDTVRTALLDQDGPLGRLLSLVEAYDANDAALTQLRLGAFPGVACSVLTEILGEALVWVTSLDADNV